MASPPRGGQSPAAGGGDSAARGGGDDGAFEAPLAGARGAAASPSAAAAAPVRDEAEADLLRNFGEHELMSRVQEALRAQLQRALDRAEAELRAQEEARAAAAAAREDVGVELYGVQQQLARVQTDLDGREREAAALAGVRGAADAERARAEAALGAARAALAEREGALEKLKGELDGVNDTARRVEKYSAEMSAELALTRRATFKAEEGVVAAEAAKSAQDTYIDGLTAQVARAAEELALLGARKDAQRAQREAALATIAEAAAEMDAVAFERAQLLQQWRSSLVAVRRRDEVIAAQHKAIAEVGAANDAMGGEEANLRRATADAQSALARHSDALDRERADAKYLEGAIAGAARLVSALSERETSLAAALAATDAEIKRLQVELNRVALAARQLERDRAVQDAKRFAVEDGAAADVAGRITNEKAARAMLKDAAALVERAHALDVARAEAENGVAAARVEALTVSARVSALRDAAAALERELGERERLVERSDEENRARMLGLEKRIAAVDRLNRAWDKIVAGAPEAENMGPLHAEVAALTKSVAATRAACEALQRRWLADQTALVTATNEAEVKTTAVAEKSSQAMLLEQKRLRLDGEVAKQRAEMRALAAGVKGMHEDMARIATLTAKNAKLAEALAVNRDVAERAFADELRALEAEAAAADARTGELRAERERLLADLLEAERQVVLWEKKIALERETQAALDPSVGKSELAGMEKEIARMRARHDALRRDQERLVAEMERAIEKREVLAMKHKSARAVTMAAAAAAGKGSAAAAGRAVARVPAGKAAGGEGDALTRIGLAQRADALRDEVEGKAAAAAELAAAVAGARERGADAAAAADARAAAAAELDARVFAAQRAVSACLYEKQKAVERAAALAKLLQRLEALDAGRLPPLTGDEAAHARARLADAEALREAVRDVVGRLADAHPELAEVLERVAQLCDTAPEL